MNPRDDSTASSDNMNAEEFNANYLRCVGDITNSVSRADLRAFRPEPVGVRALRTAASNLAEQRSAHGLDDAKIHDQGVAAAFSALHPNVDAVCGKPKHNGNVCTVPVSPVGGHLTCHYNLLNALPLLQEGSVRGTCSSPGCNNLLKHDSLCCCNCPRGICHDCVTETDIEPTYEGRLVGTCCVCLAGNPCACQVLYLAAAETGDKMLVFYHPDLETLGRDDDYVDIVTLLQSKTHVVFSQGHVVKFPATYSTPLRYRVPTVPVSTPRAGYVDDGHLAGDPVATPHTATHPDAATTAPPGRGGPAAAAGPRPGRSAQAFRAALAGAMYQGAVSAATAAPPVGLGSLGLVVDDVATHLQGTHLSGAATAACTTIPDDAPTNIHILLTVLHDLGVFRLGRLNLVYDALHLGATAAHQTFNRALFFSPSADRDATTQYLPGSSYSSVQHDSGSLTLIKTKTQDRGYPDQHFLMSIMHTVSNLLRYIRDNPFGLFVPGQPGHSLTMEQLSIWAGVIIYLREYATMLLANGHTWNTAYTTLVLYLTTHLRNPFADSTTEMIQKIAALFFLDLSGQPAAARQLALTYQDAALVTRAEKLVQAQVPRAPQTLPPRDKPKARPERDAKGTVSCPLCSVPNCVGYSAANEHACLNPITKKCAKCGIPHARTGPRQSPCSTTSIP